MQKIFNKSQFNHTINISWVQISSDTIDFQVIPLKVTGVQTNFDSTLSFSSFFFFFSILFIQVWNEDKIVILLMLWMYHVERFPHSWICISSVLERNKLELAITQEDIVLVYGIKPKSLCVGVNVK